MASESPTSPQLSHGSCRSSEGRMTACPLDQRRPLSRVFDEEVSLAQHVGHDTAVDDRLSWRAADLGAAVERPCTPKRYMYIVRKFASNTCSAVYTRQQDYNCTQSVVFFEVAARLLSNLSETSVPLVTDQERSITAAVAQTLPHIPHVLGWNHLLQDVKRFAKVNNCQVSGLRDTVRKLMLYKTEQEYEEAWSVCSQKWPDTSYVPISRRMSTCKSARNLGDGLLVDTGVLTLIQVSQRISPKDLTPL